MTKTLETQRGIGQPKAIRCSFNTVQVSIAVYLFMFILKFVIKPFTLTIYKPYKAYFVSIHSRKGMTSRFKDMAFY